MVVAILSGAFVMAFIGWLHQRATERRRAELDAIYRDAYTDGVAAWTPYLLAAEAAIASVDKAA
jgi:hypothetical protein